MTSTKFNELLNLGFDKEWLKDIKENFKPKLNGTYAMYIFDCEDLDQEVETGLFIDKCFFDNDRDLSVIHHFFEGMFYIMKNTKTNEELGQGIIDGSPFEEMEIHEDKPWNWLSNQELGADFVERENQRKKALEAYNSKLN